MKRTVYVTTLLAVAAILLVGLATPAGADRDDHHRYQAPQRSYAPPPFRCPHQQWVPPGHRGVHQGWVPPGHIKNGKAYAYCPYCAAHRDYRDGRYHDRRYDDDWGVVIRRDRSGTTIGGYYHDRNW